MLSRLFLILVLVVPLKLWAQSTISGAVYDFENKTFPLQDVKVRNLNNNQSFKTNASGDFLLQAKKGDLLEFSLIGYYTDTLYLLDLTPKKKYLSVSSTTLKEVAILGAKVNPSVFSPDPAVQPFRRFETDGLRGKKNTDRAGGLGFNLGYGKYRRQEAKIKELEARDLYETEINSVFTPEYITDLVKLKGEDLKNFIYLYRPTAALVKSERPFNYRFYTVQAYHRWLKLPPSQRKAPVMPKMKAD